MAKKTINPVIRQAWGYLFEIWRDEITFRHTPEQNRFRPIDEFTRLVKMNGWSNQALRQYAAMTRPYLVVQPWNKSKPPLLHESPNLSDLLDLKVQYFDSMNEINIPDEWLAGAIAELRKHLEYAIQLEKEVGSDKKLFHIGSILQPEVRKNDLYHSAIDFYEIFKKLAHFDSKLASREWLNWLNKDESLFIRLCICAAGISGIVSDQAFFSLLVDLNDELFWELRNRFDLLNVLAKRWNGLNEDMKKTLEQRLLAGSKPSDGETTEDFTKSNASEILNRLHWLQNHGCVFTFDLEEITQQLQSDAPEWTPDFIDHAVDSRLTSISVKVYYPDSSEYKWLSDKLDEVLNSDNNFSIKAEQIASWPREELEQILQPLIESYKPVKRDPLISWLISEERLLIESTASFYQLIDKLLEVIESMPAANLVSMESSHSHDWITEATDSLVACLAKSLMNPSVLNSFADKGVCPEQWLQSVDKLLALPENLRCFALIVFYQHVECLYSINPQWTETNFLIPLLSNENHKLAFWGGFLCLGKMPKQNFYLKLKSKFLELAKTDGLDSGFRRVLITRIFDGWLNKCNQCNERWLTDDELHDVILHGGDELRQQLIWRIQECSKKEDWLNQLPDLFRDVWPKRLSVKTPKTSKALLDLAFSNVDIFQRIADPVLPLISQTTYWQLNEDIVQHNPIKALALIHKAFAENDRAHLPYDLEDTLNCIAEIQPELRKDSQWLALKRKLD